MSGSMNTYSITLRNGTISPCTSGIYVGERTDVTINNITFIEPADLSTVANIIGVDLERSTFSTVNNCIFNGIPFPANSSNNGTTVGIQDFQSTGGNSYNTNLFVNISLPLTVISGSYTGPEPSITVDRCQFAAPPSN